MNISLEFDFNSLVFIVKFVCLAKKTESLNEQIKSLQTIENQYEEDHSEELISIQSFYQTQIKKLFNQIEQLQNEQILFTFRVHFLQFEFSTEKFIFEFLVKTNRTTIQ